MTVNDFAWATPKKYGWRATGATVPGRGASWNRYDVVHSEVVLVLILAAYLYFRG